MKRRAAPVDPKCPLCHLPMMLRLNSRSGEPFLGCIGFPKCLGARNAETLEPSGRHRRAPPKPPPAPSVPVVLSATPAARPAKGACVECGAIPAPFVAGRRAHVCRECAKAA